MNLRKRNTRNLMDSFDEMRRDSPKRALISDGKVAEVDVDVDDMDEVIDAEDSTQEVIDVENDSAIQFVEEGASTSSEVMEQMNLRGVKTDLERKLERDCGDGIKRRSWHARSFITVPPEKTILRITRPSNKDKEELPNVDDPDFTFTGHYELLPYPVYYQIIMRAKRDHSIISQEIPKLRPSAGSIIIYDCKGSHNSRQVHNDGYRWGRSKGVKQLQSVSSLVRTYHFLFSPQSPAGDPAFKKYRFNLKDDPNGILVFHYLGDEKRALVVSEKCMDRTNTALLLERGESRQVVEAPPHLNLLSYCDLEPDSSEDPRDRIRQIILENIQQIQRALLCDGDEPFLDKIEVDENTNIVLIMLFCHPLIDQLSGVANFLQQGNPFSTVMLYYHTEQCSVDYQISTLSFAHPFFEGDPILPIAHMISLSPPNSKNVDHDYFLSTICVRFNDLQNGRFVIVTEQNLNFTTEAFPVAEHVRCWADFKRIKLGHLEENFSGNVDLSEYAGDMDTLMHCPTQKQFDECWAKIVLCKRYATYPKVANYFMNMWGTFSAIWNLKLAGVREPDKGIFLRNSNELKKVITTLDDNNAHLDSMIISLFFLSNAFRRHLMAGMHQCGAWRLKKSYRDRFQQSHLRLPKLPYAPAMENIVSVAFGYCPDRTYKNNSRTSNAFDDKVYHSNMSENNSFEYSDPSLNQHLWPQEAVASSSLGGDEISPRMMSYVKLSGPSVRLVSSMTFIVRGKSGIPHVVEATQADESEPLQWYCSCGRRDECTHVRKAVAKINE